MDDTSKMIGENGCFFLDSSATNTDTYMIAVLEDAVFTVLNEAEEQAGTEVNVLATMNLAGKTVKAGAILTPYGNVFSDISISSGSVMCYKLSRS